MSTIIQKEARLSSRLDPGRLGIDHHFTSNTQGRGSLLSEAVRRRLVVTGRRRRPLRPGDAHARA
jgi:hypothetical protein